MGEEVFCFVLGFALESVESAKKFE
jgi:hypothetical protein